MHYLLARVSGTELINLATGIWDPLAQTITVDSCKLLVPQSSSARSCSFAAEDFSDVLEVCTSIETVPEKHLLSSGA